MRASHHGRPTRLQTRQPHDGLAWLLRLVRGSRQGTANHLRSRAARFRTMRAQVSWRNTLVLSHESSFLPVSVVQRFVRVPGGGFGSFNVPSSRQGVRRQGCGAVTQGARGPRRWGLKCDSRGGWGHRDAARLAPHRPSASLASPRPQRADDCAIGVRPCRIPAGLI